MPVVAQYSEQRLTCNLSTASPGQVVPLASAVSANLHLTSCQSSVYLSIARYGIIPGPLKTPRCLLEDSILPWPLKSTQRDDFLLSANQSSLRPVPRIHTCSCRGTAVPLPASSPPASAIKWARLSGAAVRKKPKLCLPSKRHPHRPGRVAFRILCHRHPSPFITARTCHCEMHAASHP